MSATVFNKPLSDELTKKADINSPALTGTPTAPTAAAGTNTTQIATTAFVQSKLDKPAQAGTLDQILRSDGNGNTVWTNAATQTEIGTAVTNWLDTNVPTGTTVVIDKSLSVADAAAEAKATGDMILVDDTQPSATSNKLWIVDGATEEYTIPTSAELNDVRSALTIDEAALYDIPYQNALTVVSGGVNTSTGTNNSNTNRARTQYNEISPGSSYVIDLSNTDYCIINVWVYSSSNTALRAVYAGNSDPIVRRVSFNAGENEQKFRVCFAKNDKTTTLTSTDYTAIGNALTVTVKPPTYAYRGQIGSLGYTSIAACTSPGWYGIGVSAYASLSDLPDDIDTSVVSYVNVYYPGAGLESGNPIVQELTEINGKGWVRRIYNGTASDWETKVKDAFIFRGYIADLGYTALTSCMDSGWYGFASSDYATITDLPLGFAKTGGGTLIVYNPVMAKQSSSASFKSFIYQFFYASNGKTWSRTIRSNGVIQRDWLFYSGGLSDKYAGKTVAILGASNDTNGNPGTGDNTNAVEITVTADDVGVELSAYLTYYDVQAGLSLGGHTYTSSEIGDEVTFTPTSDDIGKMIGRANNYNSNSLKTWWEVAADALGFTPIPVCWSGSSVTSHEGTQSTLKTSYAWHDAQIRKCGIRTPGTMTRTAPDVIIITRGLNDYGHDPYNVVLTDGYFDDPDFEYPTTDALPNDKYGFMEGLVLTIKKLRAAYPKAQIMLATMKMALRPAGMWSAFPPRNGTNTIIQYSEAFRKVAEYMGCHLLELDKCGITYENFLDNYCIDTTGTAPSHANAAGHKLMGERAIIDMLKLDFGS